MVNAQKYIDENETIRRVSRQEETVWINPDYLPVEPTCTVYRPKNCFISGSASLA